MIDTDQKILSPNHQTALLYFAGLTKLEHVSAKDLSPLIINDQNVKDIQFPLCHLLFECQCTKVIPDVLTKGNHDFDTENDLDYFVHGFCLAHSHPSCLWSVSIHTDSQVEMMAMGMHYEDVAFGNGGRIKMMYSATANSKIFEFHPHINDVEELVLDLLHTHIQLEFFKGIPVHFPKLQTLRLAHRNSSLDDYQNLVDVLPKLKHLKTLMIFDP